MQPGFKTVALIGKYKSPEIAGPLTALGGFLEGRGVKVIVDPLTAQHLPASRFEVHPLEETGRRADLAVVLGGDGTMLNIARTFAPFEVALVGVNQGRLGFLTDISVDTTLETIGSILDGHYVTEERMLLEAEVVRGGQSTMRVVAFNDACVNKGSMGRMIEFDVRIDGQYVCTQRADGMIVATPTGSTAYSLSAGGPIVHPSLSVITLVPVCPHALSNRPIVVGSDSTVEIVMRDAGDARAHFDSHSRSELSDGDTVRAWRYPHTMRLLHPAGHRYYDMLREKLGWSGAFAAATRPS
jgi:NAD+ kinase